MKIAPDPSPLTYPFARLSKVLHFPSLLSIPAMPKEMWAAGVSIACTPPTIAISQLPLWIDSMARCRATRELEQAVSSGALGPRKLSKNEIRLTKTEWELPEAL